MSKKDVAVPGPRERSLLGSFRSYRRDPLKFFLDSAIQFGGLVRFRMAHKQVFLVVEPAYIKRVLQDNSRNYVKGVSYDSLKLLLGQGLLVSEGALWQRQRRLAQPAFHRQRLATQVDLMTTSVSALIERWGPPAERGKPVDLVSEMLRLALDFVGRVLMGAEMADEINEIAPALATCTDYLYRRMEAPVKWPAFLPTPRNRRFQKCVRALEDVVTRVIERHRDSNRKNDDLLTILMQTRDEETGERMSDRQLRDEILTFLLAGHETTGDALSWTWVLLAQHQDVERRLQAELDQVLGGRIPAAKDLDRLTYCGQVIDESMRLYPPAWSVTRTAVAEDRIDGYHIPAGAILIISPYVNHRHPRFWKDPEAFDPDRFAPERAGALPNYAYFPFGGGAHLCIGKNMAVIELKLAVSMIAQAYQIRLVPGQDIAPEPGIALHPRSAIMATLHKRE